MPSKKTNEAKHKLFVLAKSRLVQIKICGFTSFGLQSGFKSLFLEDKR